MTKLPQDPPPTETKEPQDAPHGAQDAKHPPHVEDKRTNKEDDMPKQ